MDIFPVYLLKLDCLKVIHPEDKQDIGHTDFWENVVSKIVATYFHIPQVKLVNLPYCQQRARICGEKIYFGEETTPELLQLLQKTIDNKLFFVYDNHEKRLREDVLAFRRLVKVYRPKSTIT